MCQKLCVSCRRPCLIDPVEEEEEGLEEHQGCHDPVDPEHLLCSVLLENEHPEAAGEEERSGEHLVESRQGHLPRRLALHLTCLIYISPAA